jgi:hypothetical protein
LCNDPALVPLPRTARHAVTMIRSLTGGGGGPASFGGRPDAATARSCWRVQKKFSCQTG